MVSAYHFLIYFMFPLYLAASETNTQFGISDYSAFQKQALYLILQNKSDF
jgi:hypothetical protein